MSEARRSPAAVRPPGKKEQFQRKAARLQQRKPLIAVVFATYQKFSDDQAGYLAALIAYYGFASLLPMLLVLISFLELIAADDPGLRQHLLDSALSQYPGVAGELRQGSGIGNDDGDAATHCLGYRQAETFAARGQHQDGRSRVKVVELLAGDRPRQIDRVLRPGICCGDPQGSDLPVVILARHDQPGLLRQPGSRLRKGAYEDKSVLVAVQGAHEQDDGLTSG